MVCGKYIVFNLKSLVVNIFLKERSILNIPQYKYYLFLKKES